MKPKRLMSREEMHTAYAQGEAAGLAPLEVQAKLIASLKAHLKALQDQLAKNTRNSNQAPSNDGLNVPAPKSRREKSGKPSGGNVGLRLEPIEEPDRIEVQRVAHCFIAPDALSSYLIRNME